MLEPSGTGVQDDPGGKGKKAKRKALTVSRLKCATMKHAGNFVVVLIAREIKTSSCGGESKGVGCVSLIRRKGMAFMDR